MKLYIVGTGAGNAGGMTLDAQSAIQASDIVVGYTLYVELLRSIFPEKNYLSTGMKSEAERVNLALSEAQNGKTVALICSGDSGVYGMAGLALELSENYTNIDIEIVPGVTAALSGGALLGAPLGHDFAVISLSDPRREYHRNIHKQHDLRNDRRSNGSDDPSGSGDPDNTLRKKSRCGGLPGQGVRDGIHALRRSACRESNRYRPGEYPQG